jgi:hypothetical protein
MDGDGRSSCAANGQTVHWVIAVLLAVIATCLVVRSDGTGWLPEAEAQAPRLGARGMMAFNGQLGPRTYGLFMVDVDAGNVWCYEYSQDKGKLRLVAARSFIHDRYLTEFNVEPPTPSDVAQLVDRLRSRKPAPSTRVVPDAGGTKGNDR